MRPVCFYIEGGYAMNVQPRPTAPDHVCPRFERSPLSLIEEPEICENCGRYQDGFCHAEEGSPCETTR